MTRRTDWLSVVPRLAELPRASQHLLINHAHAVAMDLPGGHRARYRVTHEVLSDLTDASLMRADHGWDPQAAVARALVEFGDPVTTRDALISVFDRVNYRHRSARAGALTMSFAFWWMALFPFARAEPWSEHLEPVIPSLADEFTRLSIVVAIVTATICRLVIKFHHRFDSDLTSTLLRWSYRVEAAATATSLAGLSTYTTFRYAKAPHSLSATSLLIAFALGVVVIVAVRAAAKESDPATLRIHT